MSMENILTAHVRNAENVPGERKNATFEKRSDGVKRDTLRRLSCWEMCKDDEYYCLTVG